MDEISVVTGLQSLWQSDAALGLLVTFFAIFAPFAKTCGLALVQTLAVRHGAQARIAAQPGQGCTVQLAWPAAHPAAHQPNQTGPV